MTIVAVIDYWDDPGDGTPGHCPSRYVEQVDNHFLAVYTWLPMAAFGPNADTTCTVEEEIIGVFDDVNAAIRRLWKRDHTMTHLCFPDLYGTLR